MVPSKAGDGAKYFDFRNRSYYFQVAEEIRRSAEARPNTTTKEAERIRKESGRNKRIKQEKNGSNPKG